MYHVKRVALMLACLMFLTSGCIGIIEVDVDDNNHPHVNTYVRAPNSILRIIEPYVVGYFSPSLNRYGRYLYPPEIWHDDYNLPCYVRSDFNGDDDYDYAFLFSKEEWRNGNWYVTTKLLVVLSTRFGYELSCNATIGTTFANISVPVEEFWSIRYVPAGTHSLVSIVNGVKQIKTVTLRDDAIFMASLDPDDETIFYAVDDEVFEIDWSGAVRSTGRAISKSSFERRSAPIPLVDFTKRPLERTRRLEIAP